MIIEFRTAVGRAAYRRYLTRLMSEIPLTHAMAILVGAAFDLARSQKRIDVLEFAVTNIIQHMGEN